MTIANLSNLSMGSFAIPKELVKDFEIETVNVPVFTGTLSENSWVQKIQEFLGEESRSNSQKLENWELKEVKKITIKLGENKVIFCSTISKALLLKTRKVLESSDKLPEQIEKEKFYEYLDDSLETYGMVTRDFQEIEKELKTHFSTESGISVTSISKK